MTGLILAAPASGSGKTTVTLGLLRALAQDGVPVRGAKSGPDYIDPRFHEAACGKPCLNLDAWAMSPARITALAAGDGLLIVEGAMGLYDGAPPDGKGSVADLARILGLPVVLVIDVARQAQSVAAVATGFRALSDFPIAGLILNKVGSARHERMLRRALEPVGLPVLGAVPRTPGLETPSRHLGLVQAQERSDLEVFLDRAAGVMRDAIDLTSLQSLATALPKPDQAPPLPPPAQRVAVAQDAAFAFAYPHLTADWRAQGAEILPFSPLADDPVPDCDLVFLPGGYPELHAGHIAANARFLDSLRAAPAVYGECGGYMVMGDGLVDAGGTRHAMAGLLRLETSFAQRKLHLGYRRLCSEGGPWLGQLLGHEFHYASTLRAEGPALFTAQDAEGTALPDMGLRHGSHCGSFAHVIDAVVGSPDRT